MTLAQLKNVVEVARLGSISKAGQENFLTPSALSKSLAELEDEMNVTIFDRSSKGAVLTDEGVKFLGYAKSILDQCGLLEDTFKRDRPRRRVFAVSAQHYAFAVNAFVALVREYGESEYEFSLREQRTHEIIDDVHLQRSELGILFLSQFNREVMQKSLYYKDLEFIPEFTANPHVFVARGNPLAMRDRVTREDLLPYPRLRYDQGTDNSFYLFEEPHSVDHVPKNIVVTDRATLFNLLIGLDGYTISSGILSEDLNGTDIVSIPLESEEIMEVGYIHPIGQSLSPLAKRYLEHFRAFIASYERE